MSKKMDRFMELEGLRGIAAFSVVAYHFIQAFYPVMYVGMDDKKLAPVQHMRFEDNLYGSPLFVLLSGTFAVAIFFVLSGFVLSIGYFKTKDTNIVKKLALKRYVRLMLPALASILVCLLLVSILGRSAIAAAAEVSGSHWLSVKWDMGYGFIDAFYSGVVDIFASGGSNKYNLVLWTMMTEFWGSFMVFGVLLLFAASRYRWVVYLLLMLLTFNTWFAGFIIGMIMADAYASGYHTKIKDKLLPIAILAVGAIYFGGFPRESEAGESIEGTVYGPLVGIFPVEDPDHRMIYTTIGASMLVALVLVSTFLTKLLAGKYISQLGRYTYSLYLVHIPVLLTLTVGLFTLFHRGGVGYNWATLASFLVSLPVIIFATYLFEKYVDAPSIRFSSLVASVYTGQKQIAISEKIAELRLRFAVMLYSFQQKFYSRRLDDE